MTKKWQLFFSVLILGLASCKYDDASIQQKMGNNNVGGTFAPSVGRAVQMGYTHRSADNVASYTAVPLSQIPNWQNQPFAGSLFAFQKSCLKLNNQSQWAAACQAAAQTPNNHTAAKQFFERHFTAWQVAGNGSTSGTVTGYYEPLLGGDTRQTANARYPIYGIPNDMVTLNVGNNRGVVRVRQTGQNSAILDANGAFSANLAQFTVEGNNVKGRFSGSQFVPYFTRNDINGGALNGRAPILAYANDPVELFFLHIQGSGRLVTPNGQIVRLGFADKNNYPFVSVAKYMANRGYLPLAQTTMQGIKSFMQQNPSKLTEILGQNPRYIFFRQLDGASTDGPIGALGVPLTNEFSAAVDKKYITLGAPLFVATTHPTTGQAHNRLLVAQDTGSAIKGAVRVDYFWGYGDAAGQIAGKMKHAGQVWQLLPNGVLPN